jgi:hypothetical protein
MKISGKFHADIVGFTIKRNQAHDGREGFITLEMGIEQEEAEKKLGADFESLAFSTMRIVEAQTEDDTDQIAYMQDTIKPGKRWVFERHLIDIDGKFKLDDQPEMLSIRPVDGSRKVIVRIRIGVDMRKASFVTFFGQHVGETAKIEFNPQQGELALAPGPQRARASEDPKQAKLKLGRKAKQQEVEAPEPEAVQWLLRLA